ncbi:putative cytidine triphosphate synthase putativeCTP synthase [Leptomonas pyrrhocoris]|uniref:CTP synthase n=1 Tax=Leptomonas pyrrhocoris TaxID=157538 RepID=A0A0N0DRY3_LEPPY|nr:putative cytidine triphosphate synthase putativeCTP synthase [Leptomonas pyrrhocoris]XP_015653782.1 putative cytidine triphosphate synthase putativeCTP synthase [Leptomonas pyrrhocoris]XP_015653783.1 putative cytidine triphosphate synthase putativeCTP synthase [Leptomonas pyrrhocoris]KPA75342.1 putative cytidine triphosphate synthase putativeCTP synthase [Leptomonas pyrrhocoris]KPA75343.1 putative cytidine triphosphate synthase putativeCTP synthase [Leptomonas pyrrhocoris]KPA75344.1 putativ|eukprot:XP_015653781.1 putative cytidine triphosphate synthase putativeCTP synthase [Leptomonas pyrrhocoris]
MSDRKIASGSAYYLPSPMLLSQNQGEEHVKFIVVSGGVCSSLGKGITTSATGAMLRAAGYRVCSIKIDPYINIDAGLMSPFEHGEVYVLEDGGEADLDLGNYERWLSVHLTRDHNITTGKVYQKLLTKERAGGFLGKTVQLVPHFTNEVVNHIFKICETPMNGTNKRPEICMIELGGTVGDMESQPFVEALRRLRYSILPEDFCLLHTTYLPVFGGTQKTKPTQHSCRALLSLGLQPDFLICRSEQPLAPEVKNKLADQCGVQAKDIIGAPNVPCLYQIPVEFVDQGLIDRIVHKLRLRPSVPPMDVPTYETFKKFTQILQNPANPKVRIAFVGKYVTGGSDAYFSVLQTFEHCQLALGINVEVFYLESEELEGANAEEAKAELRKCDGIFVPGGFGVRGVNGKVIAVELARTHNIPYFGVCLGMQIALIEFARHVLGWTDANSEEFDATSTHQMVRIMDADRDRMGANMHLGARDVHIVEPKSTMSTIYSGAKVVLERHRHRYEVNAKYLEDLRKAGMTISAVSDPGAGDNMRVEAIEQPSLKFFLAVQYHPEFVSTPLDPSPPYLAFFAAAAGKAVNWPAECQSRRLAASQRCE